MIKLTPVFLLSTLVLASCNLPLTSGRQEAGILYFDASGPYDLVHSSWQVEGKYRTANGKVAEFRIGIPNGTHENTISHLLSDSINVSAGEECTRPLECPDGPDYLAGNGDIIELSVEKIEANDLNYNLTVHFFDRD